MGVRKHGEMWKAKQWSCSKVGRSLNYARDEQHWAMVVEPSSYTEVVGELTVKHARMSTAKARLISEATT